MKLKKIDLSILKPFTIVLRLHSYQTNFADGVWKKSIILKPFETIYYLIFWLVHSPWNMMGRVYFQKDIKNIMVGDNYREPNVTDEEGKNYPGDKIPCEIWNASLCHLKVRYWQFR